jgi:hypothetical protein
MHAVPRPWLMAFAVCSVLINIRWQGAPAGPDGQEALEVKAQEVLLSTTWWKLYRQILVDNLAREARLNATGGGARSRLPIVAYSVTDGFAPRIAARSMQEIADAALAELSASDALPAGSPAVTIRVEQGGLEDFQAFVAKTPIESDGSGPNQPQRGRSSSFGKSKAGGTAANRREGRLRSVSATSMSRSADFMSRSADFMRMEEENKQLRLEVAQLKDELAAARAEKVPVTMAGPPAAILEEGVPGGGAIGAGDCHLNQEEEEDEEADE